jgi:hypothetical protein
MYKNPMADVRPPTDKLAGFWRGIVEDNEDPLKAGRVRVRIHGLHTENTRKIETDGIPVDELPWAEPCFPIYEGSVSELGAWSVPVQGSHVMIFFEGMNLSQPRYFASMPGIPEDTTEVRRERGSPDKSKGFKDPDNVYPLLDRLGEPDVDRLARGESSGTIVETKDNNRDTAVDIACGGTWDEPESPYAAVYPHNFVIHTHGGVTIEMDSTPDKERVHVYHPSKSYVEIDKDGQMVIKNESSRYEIVVSDNNIHIQQNRNLTTDGNYNRLTKTDECIQVNGNRTENIDGNVDETIGGDETREVTGDVDETIGGDETREIDGNVDITIHSGLTGLVEGTGTITIDGLLTLTGNGTIEVSTSNLNLDGGDVQAGSSGDTRYYLMDERMINVYNTHKHYSGSGLPEPPLLATGSHTTTNLTGS